MKILHISEKVHAVKDTLDGIYDRDGMEFPVSGWRLKCFGHPIAASGCACSTRCTYNSTVGRGAADSRPRFGLTHNLGGVPFMNVCSIAIIGKY